MDCQDLQPNKRTTGVIEIGHTATSDFGLCHSSEPNRDTDWFSVQLVYGQTYVFTLELSEADFLVPPQIQVAGHYGIIDQRIDRSGQFFVQYTARFTGQHYISVFQGDVQNGTEYSIANAVLNDDNKGDIEPINLTPGFAVHDRIETAGDSDMFRVTLFEGRTYSIALTGEPQNLAGASLQLRDSSGNEVASNSRSDHRVAVTYTPIQSGIFEVVATGSTGPGDYRLLAYSHDDAVMGPETTSTMSFDQNGTASVTGYVDRRHDIDWHRIRLNQGDLVKATLNGSGIDFLQTPTMIFRGPDRELLHVQYVRRPTDNNGPIEYYYLAETTGDHFLVARTNVTSYIGGYEATVEKTRTPISHHFLFGRGQQPRLLTLGNGSVQLDELVDVKGLKPNRYEVFSTAPLTRNGVGMEANRLYTIPGNELGLWRLDQVVDGLENLGIRARVADSWSQWTTFPVFGIADVGNLNSGRAWANPQSIKYRFVDELPSYFGPGEFTDFTSAAGLTNLNQTIFSLTESINESGLDLSITPAADGEAADINIFIASGFPARTQSYLPGPNRGGDIALNSTYFNAATDLSIGTIEYFNLVRSFAHALGLNFINDGSTHSQSVMAANAHSGGLYPSNFGVNDLWTLASIYGSTVLDPTVPRLGSVDFALTEGNEISTIAFHGRAIAVDPSLVPVDAVIDLRDGARSYLMNAGVRTNELYIGTGAAVYDATSVGGNDRLSGNSLKNVLTSGDGNDFLIGYELDDELFGGDGDDIYIHYFGDGRDFIFDSSGTDTLCFFGRDDWHVDQLSEDYEFTRNGQYLDINLTLDGGLTEGFVRIDTGPTGENLIERLELWHDTSFTARISLLNIFNRLADGETGRFRVTDVTDQYGALVTPI